MGEEYKFCYSGNSSSVKGVFVSPDISWDDLVSSLKKSLQMSAVTYIELVDSSNSVVGERIADLEDFVTSCRYLDDDMVFKVHGLGPKPEKRLERPDQCDMSSLLDNAYAPQAYNPMNDFVPSMGGAVVKKKSRTPTLPSTTDFLQGDSHDSTLPIEPEDIKTSAVDSLEPLQERTYPGRASVPVEEVLPAAPEMRAASRPQSPPATSADSHTDEPDFTASLQSILAGISKLEDTIEFPSDYSRAIINSTPHFADPLLSYAPTSYASGSMAGLKTSAEIEMERRQAEEEQKRQQALEDARKLRELLEAECIERERLKEAVHRKGSHSRDGDDDTPRVAGKHQHHQQQQPSPSMYGRSAGRARAPSSEDDEYEEEAWARAEEDKARRRAQEVERKMRVVAITSQRRAQEEEGIVSGPSPDGAHLKPMGGVRLPAMRLEHPVDISFRSVLDVSTIVAVQVEDQCDWIELTTMVGVYLGLDSPDKITHFILVDEDGDETSGQISDHFKFWKFHARRYMSGESMSFVVHHAPNDPSIKPPVAMYSSSKPAHSQEPPIRSCGSAKGGKLNFRLSTDYVDDKVDVTIEADASWSDICGAISRRLKVDTEAVQRLSLFDDEGDELLMGIDSADFFWKAVEGRYSPSHTVFVVMVNEADAAPPAAPGVSVYCSLTKDMSKKISVTVPLNGSWEDISNAVVRQLKVSGKRLGRATLTDDDGDEVLGGIENEKKFWKAVNSRYDDETMYFVLSLEDAPVVPPTSHAVGPKVSVLCRLSTEKGQCKHNVDVPLDGDWEAIGSSIVDGLQLEGLVVDHISLVDDDGDDVMGGITSDKKFWKAVNSRYSEEDMAFVVSTKKGLIVKKKAATAPPKPVVPTTPLNFRLSTEEDTAKTVVAVPVDGEWESICAVVIESFGFGSGSSVVGITLLDSDGDEVLGSITSDKKFWKAAKRYNAKETTFVATVDVVAAPPAVPAVPTVPIYFKQSVGANSKSTVRIPVGGDWEAIGSSIVDGLQLEGLVVDHISLVDDDGDDVMGGITSDKKFWKAVNSRYSEEDMAFVVSTKKGLIVKKKAATAPPKPVVPTTPLNFRLSTEEDTAKTVVAVPVDGEWESICAVVIESFGFGSGSSVVGITLLDSDGDEVLGSITSDKKFWKAAKRYNAKETTFVATVDVVAAPPAVPAVPTVPIYFRLSTDSIVDKAVIDIPLSGSWEDVLAPLYDFFKLSGVTIDRICLLDDDGDEIFSSIMNETKFWKAVNTRYDSGYMVFVIHSSPSAPGSTVEDVPTLSFSFCLPNSNDYFDIAIPEYGKWIQIQKAVAGFFNFPSGESVTHLQLVDIEWDDVFSKISDDKKFWKAATTKYIAGETFFVAHHDDAHHVAASDGYTYAPHASSSRAPTAISYEPPTPGSKYEGQLVSASCKLSTDYISDAADVLIPAMGTWEKITEVLCENFHLPVDTQIDHVDLINDEGDVIMGNIVSASKFWNVFLEMYKENETMFNITQKPPTVGLYSSRRAAAGGGVYNATSSSGGMYNTTPSSGGIYQHSSGTNGGSIYASARRGDDYADVTDTSESTRSFGRGQSLNTSNHSASSAGTDRTSPEVATFLSACGDGDVAAVSDILQKGADVNMKDSAGLTGLHVACIRGSLKVVELLVEKEASISCRDMDGMTPLHFCCENDHTQIAIYIVRMGGDTSLRNKSGLTSLHYICMNGNMQLTVLIRDYMINVATSTGLTLLHCAADMGHEEMVDYLVEHGAQLQPRDDEGLTPLHMAAMGGHIGVVEMLIDLGAYWNVRDDEGNSPLLLAAREGNADMVDCLIDCGGNVLARNDKGESALHLACEAGSMDLVKLLLERNLDINCRNKKGETPLDIASVNGHDHLVEWMEDRGASMVPETPTEASTRAKVEAKTEQAARAFEAEEELNLQRELADEHSKTKKR